jgi:hypothetical protein
MFGWSEDVFVMTQLSKLPEEKVRPLLNERQWRRIVRGLAPYRAREKFLIDQGVMEK